EALTPPKKKKRAARKKKTPGAEKVTPVLFVKLEIDVNKFRTLATEKKNQEAQSSPPQAPEQPIGQLERKARRASVTFAAYVFENLFHPIHQGQFHLHVTLCH